MKRFWFQFLVSMMLVIAVYWISYNSNAVNVFAQQPTANPAGAYITVTTDEPQINVRMGPSSSIYPIVGTLVRGETAPALGRSQGGDWIKIEFPGAPYNQGWVYSPLVQVTGTLLVVGPPPTPPQPPTSTVDPTLAAQFTFLPTGTRPPTYTPPAPINTPSFSLTQSSRLGSSIPLGVVILAFLILGVVGFFISILPLRR